MRKFKFIQFPPAQKDKPSAWEIWRHENIDAEDAACLSGENPWESAGELLKRKAAPEPIRKPVTEAMIKGREMRPQALNAYRNLCGIRNLHPGNIENIENPWMIAHPDLIDGTSLHIAEVHCGESTLRKALTSGFLPKPYWAEAQHTLMATGLKFLHVYLHNPVPTLTPKTFKVWASQGFQKELLAQEMKFLGEIKTLREANSAKSQKQAEAAALEATLKAIKGIGPKVPLATFRKFVPQFLTRNGEPTQAGLSLLSALAE